jgi:hypothetical protein
MTRPRHLTMCDVTRRMLGEAQARNTQETP